MLEDEGLLTRIPGLGYYVTEVGGSWPAQQAGQKLSPLTLDWLKLERYFVS